jgi:hypothetical protein
MLNAQTSGKILPQKKALPYSCKARTCAHRNKTPTQPYKSPPRTTSTVLEMGSQEKTQAPVAAYIAMTAGTKTVNWIIMAGHSSKGEKASQRSPLPTIPIKRPTPALHRPNVRAACTVNFTEQQICQSAFTARQMFSTISSKPLAAVPSEPSKQSVSPSPEHLWCSQHSRREVSNYFLRARSR